ncbi:MAG: methyltransferase domain-containing protein [Flavobacteriales bacterium]|nr:methyltransferase domain-containing protein [Flavobacteriales bacterium]
MAKSKDNLNWFEDWFDSPYYHILYKNRDMIEAESFISNLLSFLKPLKTDLLLDVACGKGRHAKTINDFGFCVDAFDLSENSIKSAKQFENEQLHFYVNDIRNPLKNNHYNFAFNLFTSFGYFDDDKDNVLAINAIAESLKPNGTLVLDFMNASKIIANLVESETKTIDGITFIITKKVINNFIVKQIDFEDKGTSYSFQERVKAISQTDFIRYFNLANLKIETTFGDYDLNPFNENTSERLIIVAKK